MKKPGLERSPAEIIKQMESLEFRLESFEGPLDLLLQLIEKNKADIFDIPIAVITDQYLQYLDELKAVDLDNLSDFLVMACTLLEIKAKMLLPKEEDENGEEIDPRLELEARLAEYREYKEKAQDLRTYEEESAGQCVRSEDLPDEVRHYKPAPDYDELLKDVSLEKLKSLFEMILKKQEDKIDPIRASFGTIRTDPVRISDKLSFLTKIGRERKRFTFRNLLESQKTRADVVVTFLAVLELVKIGQLHVKQEDTFSEIELTWDDTVDASVSNEELKQYE